MTLILALSTSAARGSVALLEGEQLRGQRHYDDQRRHAERIFGEIDALLQQVGVERNELGAIACDVGPGSFTGTRVGVSSAKGIALGLGIPLWPVCALQAMALAAFEEGGAQNEQLMPCVDGKRGELFYAVYNRSLQTLVEPSQVARQQLVEVARVHGARTTRCGAVLDELAPTAADAPLSRLTHPACAVPEAAWQGRLAWRQFHDREAPALALVEPIYVRAPDAVPNLPKPPVLMDG